MKPRCALWLETDRLLISGAMESKGGDPSWTLERRGDGVSALWAKENLREKLPPGAGLARGDASRLIDLKFAGFRP